MAVSFGCAVGSISAERIAVPRTPATASPATATGGAVRPAAVLAATFVQTTASVRQYYIFCRSQCMLRKQQRVDVGRHGRCHE